jgi:hypothetical protein
MRRVYCAGKIAKGDWRHELSHEVRCVSGGLYDEPSQAWPATYARDLGFVYTGPYFVSCDHGCYHGNGSHGSGLLTDPLEDYSGCGGEVTSQEQIHAQCLAAIRRSDVVFVWVDSLSAYGTLVEVGYATALGKTIWLAHDGRDYSDLWFLFECAHEIVKAPSPVSALSALLLERAA